jgi:quinol monooxygenase YgiN
MSAMIHVIATVEVVAGRRAAFLEEFHRLMPQVHAEDGCLEYGPTLDVTAQISPAQVARREDVVTIVEKWRDLEALQAHLVAPHMQTYRQRVKDLVLGVSLQVLSPAE